jgi:hypothetical protein
MRTGLIAGFAVLVVAVVFIIQNAHSQSRQVIWRALHQAQAG